MRINAPLPAERGLQWYHASPASRLESAWRTIDPIPKIWRLAKTSTSRCGARDPCAARCSSVQNASWVSSVGTPTRRYSAYLFGR